MLLSLKAKANSSDLSGSCGAVFGLSNPAEALWEFANNSVDDEGINAISVINFDNSTMSYEITRLVITAPSTGEWRRTTFNNVTFTVSTHPSIPKIKIITLTNGEIFNLLPINGKKTYLIQGVTFGSTGVCSEL
jgi:hypothetical protein